MLRKGLRVADASASSTHEFFKQELFLYKYFIIFNII